MKKIYLLVVLILAIALRMNGLGFVLFGDEGSWADAIIEPDIERSTFIIPHPPLGLYSYKAMSTLLGYSVWSMRLVPLLFGLLSTLMVYILARKQFNEKTADIALGMMAFFFYPILASLQIDIDAILMFIALICSYCYLEYKRYFSTKWLVATGALLAILMMTKYTGIIFYAVFFFDMYFHTKNIGRTLKTLFPVFLFSIVLFTLFPLTSFAFGSNVYMNSLGHSMIKNYDKWILGDGDVFTFLAIRVFEASAIIWLWMTPLLLGLAVLSLFNFRKEKVFYLLWIICTLLFLVVFIHGDYSRNFIFIIPPMILLSSSFLAQVRFTHWEKLSVGLMTMLTFFFLLMLNFLEMIRYKQSVSVYFNSIFKGNWSFFFPYSVSSGSWFGINFLSIALMSIISVPLFFMIIPWIQNNTMRFGKVCLVIFLGVGIGFNLFLAEEYLFHGSQPNSNMVAKEMINYVKLYDGDIYVTNKGLTWYLDGSKTLYYRLLKDYNKDIEEKGGMILYLDFARDIDLNDIHLNQCELLKTVSSLGQVYHCSPPPLLIPEKEKEYCGFPTILH